jgi:hypothetical protein
MSIGRSERDSLTVPEMLDPRVASRTSISADETLEMSRNRAQALRVLWSMGH